LPKKLPNARHGGRLALMKLIYNMYRYRVVRVLSKGLLAYAIFEYTI
jgi:hypothetical protein